MNKFVKIEDNFDDTIIPEQSQKLIKDVITKATSKSNAPPTSARLLKVKGKNASKDAVSRLTMAIMRSLTEHNYAELQAIAPPAIARMTRAVVKANSFLSEYTNDYILVMKPHFVKIRVAGDEMGEVSDDYVGEDIVDGIRARVFVIEAFAMPGP